MKRRADHSVTPDPEEISQRSKQIKLEPFDESDDRTRSTLSDTLISDSLLVSASENPTTKDEGSEHTLTDPEQTLTDPERTITDPEISSPGLTDLLTFPTKSSLTHERKPSEEDDSQRSRMPSLSSSLDHTTIPLEKKLTSDSTAYTGAERRLLVFDYDGTLVPIVNDPAQALLPTDVRLALMTLASNKKNDVWIVSGRDRQFLSSQFGFYYGIGLYAEHGAFLRQPGQSEWQDLVKMKGSEFPWWAPTHGIFTGLRVTVPGSHIEKKTAALVWHYRGNQEEGAIMAPAAKRLLEQRMSRQRWGAHVTEGKCVIEVRPNTNNKGHVMKQLLDESLQRHNQLPEFVFCVGDDSTDEGKSCPDADEAGI